MAIDNNVAMAILQDVDKCMRCNGCTVGCKRTWEMKAPAATDAEFVSYITTGTAKNGVTRKVNAMNRVMVKSQRRLDMEPFVRYSCWHCVSPPCASHCPFGAISKEAKGGVVVDMAKCDPDSPLCKNQCVTYCGRGGYPKVDIGSDRFATRKAYKCTLCQEKVGGSPRIDSLPSKDPGQAHQPTCVFTCPANALAYGTVNSIKALAMTYTYSAGDGSMFWASNKKGLAPPKADPFIEDHVAPMVSQALTGPFARAAIVPTLIAGGLLAIAARKEGNRRTPTTAGEV